MYNYQSTYTVNLNVSGIRHARGNRKRLDSISVLSTLFTYYTEPL